MVIPSNGHCNRRTRAGLLGLAFVVLGTATAFADPLPSWEQGPAKAAIIAFVETVTDPMGDGYVTPPERIAVFDNDGTLWAEQPIYFQLMFAMERARDLAAADPTFAATPTLRAAAEGDLAGVLAGGTAGLVELIDATHGGMTVAAYQEMVADWLDEAVNPETGRRLADMTYQPMLELLRYLRDEDFSTYIVTGGGTDFVRAFADAAYGVPPKNVIGSVGEATYTAEGGPPRIVKGPGIAFVDDKAGKPVAIVRHIGLRPIFAAGNSDGDFEMLEWSTAGDGPRLGIIVHHTDGEREFAYDRDSAVGRLSRGLDEAPARGWILVDMKEDWRTIWSGGN